MKKSLISLITVIQIVGFQIQVPLVSAQDDLTDDIGCNIENDPEWSADCLKLQGLLNELEEEGTCRADLDSIIAGDDQYFEDDSPQNQSAGNPSPAEQRKQVLAERAKRQELNCLRDTEGQNIRVIKHILGIIARYESQSPPPRPPARQQEIINLVRGDLQRAIGKLQQTQQKIADLNITGERPAQLDQPTKTKLHSHGLLTDLTFQTPP